MISTGLLKYIIKSSIKTKSQSDFLHGFRITLSRCPGQVQCCLEKLTLSNKLARTGKWLILEVIFYSDQLNFILTTLDKYQLPHLVYELASTASMHFTTASTSSCAGYLLSKPIQITHKIPEWQSCGKVPVTPGWRDRHKWLYGRTAGPAFFVGLFVLFLFFAQDI
jgi:hypothetical protein